MVGVLVPGTYRFFKVMQLTDNDTGLEHAILRFYKEEPRSQDQMVPWWRALETYSSITWVSVAEREKRQPCGERTC